jgi:hypothetical protein
MIRRALNVAAILAVSDIVAGALFWALLNTPDANAAMLALSALLALVIVAVAAIAVSAATLVARGASMRHALTAAPRGAGWFVIAFAPLIVAWVAIERFDRWIVSRQGEINAWFIAEFGWADISWLLRAEVWTSRWVRWAMLPVVCLSLLAALLESERRLQWLRRAFHWRTVVLATAAFAVLMVLPWQLTAWRPQLPPTGLQPAVAAVRLGAAFVLGLFGATLILMAAVRARSLDPAAQAPAGSTEG